MRFLFKSRSSGQPTPELLAFCLLIASSLQIVENILPKIPIFPWFRFGLTYLVLLPFLLRFGAYRATLLLICRNLITLIYGGQLFTSFLISTLSGIVSLGLVGGCVFFLYHRKVIGLIGAGVALACTFNLMQLMVVDVVFIRHGDFYFQLSPLLLWSVVSGGLMAFLVNKSHHGLTMLFENGNHTDFKAQKQMTQDLTVSGWVNTILAVGVFGALFVIGSIPLQLCMLPGIVIISKTKNFKVLVYAWPFYFYLAWLHLFRTDGVYIYRDWITDEGLHNFIFNMLRTTNIIFCGQWLSRHVSAFWKNAGGNSYARAILYSLPLAPALFGLSISIGKKFFLQILKQNYEAPLAMIITEIEKELRKLSR